MAYKFKILHVDEFNHSVHVNFYSDEMPEGVTYNVDILPDENGVAPTQEKMIEHIKTFMPYHIFKRAELLKNGIDISHIHELKDVEHEVIEQTKTMTENETLKLIEDLLKDTRQQ